MHPSSPSSALLLLEPHPAIRSSRLTIIMPLDHPHRRPLALLQQRICP